MIFNKARLAYGTALRFALCTLVVGACLGLTACDQSEKTRKIIDQRAGEAQQSLESTHKIDHPVIYDPLTVTSKVWSGNTALRMQRGMPLPPRYESAHGITLVSSDQMTLNDIANAISSQTGVPIRLVSLNAPGKSAAAASSSVSLPLSSGAPQGGSFGSGGGNSFSGAPTSALAAISGAEMPVSYEGPLSGLLDRVAAYFGVNWRYDGSSIIISKYETRIFTIEALPGTQQINEGMQDDVTSSSGGGSSGGSSGGSGGSSGGSGASSTNTLTQNSKITMDLKYWEELNQVLTSVLGGQGSVVTSPTMGTVTITTTPDIMETVSEYLAKENKRLSRQIAINVQIYSVNLGQSEDFNLAFTGFLKNLSKFSGLNYTSASVPSVANNSLTAQDFGSLSVAILNGPNDPTAHAGDVFHALSAIGDTTSVAQFPMTTLNNHPVSRRVGTDTSYVSSINQSTTTGTSTTTLFSPTVSTIHDGFSLQLTPRLLDDGRILLQYSLSLIGLDTLGVTTFGDLPLDLPVTDNRIFVQQSLLRSGSTLIIGGVDQEKTAQNNRGVGSPDNFLLGGGVSSNVSHFMMFMAITPQVMDVSQERN